MLLVFAAMRAELTQCKFLFRVFLILFGYVVLALTNRADEGDKNALILLCHTADYTPRAGLRQDGVIRGFYYSRSFL